MHRIDKTFVVINVDKFREIKDEQLQNINPIYWTFEVSKFEKSNYSVISEHP